MSVHILLLGIMIGLPVSAFAQFQDRGQFVEVAKGAKLCPTPDISRAILLSEKRFWRVTSKARANGTQIVEAFLLESSYDRKSGETTFKQLKYDDGYATLFKRVIEHEKKLVMVSPKDGQVEATVEICPK